jgi:hypothetical protein
MCLPTPRPTLPPEPQASLGMHQSQVANSHFVSPRYYPGGGKMRNEWFNQLIQVSYIFQFWVYKLKESIARDCNMFKIMVWDTQISRRRVAVRFPVVKSHVYLMGNLSGGQLPHVLWRWHVDLLSPKKTYMFKTASKGVMAKESCCIYTTMTCLSFIHGKHLPFIRFVVGCF